MSSRMSMYRDWQFSQMERVIPVYRQLTQNMSREEQRNLRDGGTGWTVVEVICHLRDFDGIFQQRAEMTLSQENAALPFPDPDRLARERNYNVLDASTALSQWEAARRRMMDVFQGIADEDIWNKTAAHPKRGPFSLNDQLMLVPQHDMLHLAQLIKILGERR
ncbi:MAG: DinB family protein [Chloroflexota bacterium]